MAKLIDTIQLPQGLRSLNAEELKQVSTELRDELIDSVANSGGHFASSLGATELSVALHHSFNTPEDRLVWDVGHQAYVHKMLTGRKDRLGSIRKKGGLSGFLKRSESEFDTFGAGHAGTSISAAVGMSTALQKTHPERFTVAIIGDGSLTSGMAFEALNNAGALQLKNFIVVLNDNEMSISPNVGAMSWFFSKAITSKTSTIARNHFKNLYKKGYVPEIIYKAIDRAEEAAQGFIAGPSMLFEAFGFRYIGPVDGHNIDDLLTAFAHAKQQDVPVLIHACTIKGKGYEPAEIDPIKWHGVNPFDRSKGEFIAAKAAPPPRTPPSYTNVFADTLADLAKENPEIVAITAAMAGGTGLDRFEKVHPDKFFDVGICEQHAVTFAAGLACEGKKPVCAIYSTFLQRAYDQVVHDVCIQDLPVVFAMDRGGVVGNDGETHQGVFDISYLRTLPNMVLMSPKDENEFRHMLKTAVSHPGPIGIRYPRGNGLGIELDNELKALEIGKAEVVCRGKDVLLICYGPLVSYGETVAQRLQSELGLSATVINARFAKPLDRELFAKEIPNYATVCTLEDHAVQGGFGSAVLEFVNDEGVQVRSPIRRFGIGDIYVPHASQAEQHAALGYDAKSVFDYIAAQHQTKRVVGL
ncbi:MAG: 1-deoxy-D-xylulose-5-phosphate synthase [Deltaproteobacteria bacterium]|nr:1-deoxy-D-xylulose-5-phosphate synthase [Deltaproteobacteria bacterium]